MAEETNTQQVEIRDYAIDEYVPMEARYYGAKEMTSTWICANANPTTWYMGTILGALGLGGALLSAIIGNPLVYLILALVGIIGYKVASTNMGLCRVSFGIAGSKLPSFINALQFVGWCGVNTYIAATPLATLLCSIFGGDPHSPIMLIISVYYSAYYDVRFRIRSQIHRKSADCCSGVSCNSQRVDRYPDILSRVVLGYLEMVDHG